MNPLPPPSLEDVCTQALRLPCSLSLMPRLVAVLENPASGAEEIEQIIRLDSALTAATLRLANSAFFGAGQPVETVAQGVVRLGQREVFRLAALALVNRWEAGVQSDAYGGETSDFCRHALGTAVAAELLAEKSGRLDPQTAYTAGLVCEMGKLAMAHVCKDFFPAIRARQAQQGGSWLQAERDVLDYDYAQVGAVLLRAWRFPEIYVDAAEHGCRPDLAPAASRPLLAHLHAAKYLAASLGPGLGDDGFLFELDEPFLAEWGFTPEVLEAGLLTLQERCAARLRDKLTHGSIAF